MNRRFMKEDFSKKPEYTPYKSILDLTLRRRDGFSDFMSSKSI